MNGEPDMHARRVISSLFVLLSTIAFTSSALAQGTGTGVSNFRWEIEVHGAGAFGGNSTEGTGSLPPAGQVLTTFLGTQTRRASSWYFGDGAVLMNQINAGFGGLATGRMTPLDPVLNQSGVTRKNGGAFGFRAGYHVTPVITAEFSFDAVPGRLELTNVLLEGVEASRASFIRAWNDQTGLIRTGGGVVFTNSSVTSTATINDEQGRQIFTTGALTVNLGTGRRLIPYATIGAGVVSNTGDSPSVILTGNYRFTSNLNVVAPSPFPVNETDTVTIRLVPANKHSFVTVLGGGVKIMGASRWGVRADVRAYVSNNTIDTLVDASPQVATSTPAGLVFSSTTPSIQFSNNPSTGRQSNLSGPEIVGFRTFSSRGTPVQVAVSGGYFVRF